jgi:23S rRNA-/tRNA-specific pseudouridylate synthase/ubiquinone/menaquinone biosynthesis C-methylase UbiE
MPPSRKFGGRPKSDASRDPNAPRAPRKAFGPRPHAPFGKGAAGTTRYNTPHSKPPAASIESAGAPATSQPRTFTSRSATPATREKFIVRNVPVIFEDADFLVVDKPSGMLSASLPGQKVKDPTLFDLVKGYVIARSKVKRRAWIIHRLDKETSGLVVFAKSERAFTWLKEELRAKRVNRTYVAVVEGEFEHAGTSSGSEPAAPRRQLPMGTVQSYLYEDAQGIMRSTQSPTKLGVGKSDDDDSDTDAKLAVTHFRVTCSAFGKSLLSIRLETGRKNQIRVHMLEIKHPIVGDRRYGAATDPIERVCLHASELGFTHPSTGKELRFFSPPPVAFLKLVGKKGEDTKGLPSQTDEPPAAPSAPPPPKVENQRSAAAADARPKPAPPIEPRPSRAVEHVTQPAAKDQPAKPTASPPAQASSWEHVAGWYDELIEERGSDHHENVILPNTLRLLNMKEGEKVLDVACGQGILCRKLAGLGVASVGVDASASLVASARKLIQKTHASSAPMDFRLGDARNLDALNLSNLDAATCIMALMNINPLEPVMSGIAATLRPGGRCVVVVLHPAFRSPGQTSWVWEGQTKQEAAASRSARTSKPGLGTKLSQYRRVDGYLSPGVRDIVMNPGAVAKGQPPIMTQTFHRSIQAYIKGFAAAGLLVNALEEWPSTRQSEPGPRAAEENRARREIPMFLAIRGVKLPA